MTAWVEIVTTNIAIGTDTIAARTPRRSVLAATMHTTGAAAAAAAVSGRRITFPITRIAVTVEIHSTGFVMMSSRRTPGTDMPPCADLAAWNTSRSIC